MRAPPEGGPEPVQGSTRSAPATAGPSPARSQAARLTQFSEAQRRQALARFRVLRPCLEDGVPLARLARERGLRLRTVRRWLQAYRERGLIGLVRKARADRGQRRVSPEVEQLVEGLALRSPPLSRAAVSARGEPLQ